DGVYFSTYAAQQTRQLVKEAGPLLEWSYGFSVKRSSTNYRDLAQWPGARQLLQELDVFEVSPAVKGAGIGTMTVPGSAKKYPMADLEIRQIERNLRAAMAQP